ncbi:MAG: hypothetical protein WKF54_04170 [Nocardioidaceae bacterium]
MASPERVRAAVCDRARWVTWLPGVMFTSYDDRGRLGDRWTVSGDLVGTAEVWLEEHGDGTIVHAYVRADPAEPDRLRLRRRPRRVVTRYVLEVKRRLLEVKDLLEGDRQLGSARVPIGERVVSASEDGPGGRRPGPDEPTSTISEGASPDGRPDDLQHRDRG